MKNLLIYADRLLLYSQTFVKEQGNHLRDFTPVYIGSRKVKNGISLEGCDTISINSNGSYLGYGLEYLFKRFGYLQNVRKDLLKFQPKLIHAHFGIGGALSLPIKRFLNIPLVTTYHGYDITTKDEVAKKSFLGHRIYLKRRKQLIEECDLFIAVSEFIKEKMVEKGFPESKIAVHYIGIDVQAFQPTNNKMSNEESPIVLFIGRLVEKKGCKYLIKAMQKVQQKIPVAKVVIAGDGELRNDLKAQAKRSIKNYSFLGAIPHMEVKKWIDLASVLCVPSVTAKSGDSEAFGMVFAEAQAMKTPVVSHVHGGIPEIVDDGNTGYLSPEKDVGQLADNLIKLLENPDLRQKFGEAGRKKVKKQFDIRKQTPKLELLYNNILDGK